MKLNTNKRTLSHGTAACAIALALLGATSGSSALAQIDPSVKTAGAGNVQTGIPPGFKTDKASDTRATGIPPGFKCGHNPPADKSEKTGDTRALLPAVKTAELAKKTDAQKVAAIECANK